MFNYLYKIHNQKILKRDFFHYKRAVEVRFLNFWIPQYFKLTAGNKKYRLLANSDPTYIVSLTSFPKRIEKLWLVIESILHQSVKPDRIILWLYSGEFNGKESLPKELVKLEKRGLEIRFCEADLKPHKKYFYTLKAFPKSKIITIDDDFIYPPDLIENLLKAHKKYPEAIICSMSREIKVKDNKLLPYTQWPRVRKNTKPEYKYLTMGGGGTLFPAGSLYHEVLDLEKIKKMALNNDDLWLKVMSLLNKTKVASLEGEYHRPFFEIQFEDNFRLSDTNLYESENDQVMNEILDHYKIDPEELTCSE